MIIVIISYIETIYIYIYSMLGNQSGFKIC